MKKTKLVTLLKTFSKQEMKDFEKFIASPYFSPGRNLKPLFNIIKKYYPSFDSPHFTEEKVFRKINPGKIFDKIKSVHALNVLLSGISSLAEKFLAVEVFQKDNEGYGMLNRAFSNALKNKNLITYRYKLILKILEGINKSDSLTSTANDMAVLNNDLQETLYNMNRYHEGFECVQRISLYLYDNLLLLLSKLVNDYTAQSSSYDFIARNIRLLEMGINSFDPEIFETECYDDGLGTKQKTLTMYYIIKSQLNNNDEESLMRAIEIYKTNFMKFNRFEKWSLFTSIFNICSERKSKADFKKYSLIGCDLIDFTLDKEVFGWYEGKPESPLTYISLLHFKISVSDTKVLREFIDMMIEKVQKDAQKWSYEYSYAWFSFKNNDYEKTLEYLSKFSTVNSVIKMNVNKLKILSIYSLGYIEEVIYNLDSFEHYTRNNPKISKKISSQFSLFTNSIRNFIRYRTNSKTVDENTLNKIIDDNKNSNLGFWFKEEAEKLKKAGLKPV